MDQFLGNPQNRRIQTYNVVLFWGQVSKGYRTGSCDHQTYYKRTRRAYMGKKQSRLGKHLHFFFACIIITPILMCGCSHFYEGFPARPAFKEANDFFSQGNYKASLSKYEQIIV